MTFNSSSQALSNSVARAVAHGSRVEFHSDTTAILVRGKRVNHVLHAIVSVFTLGFWLWIWLPMTIFGGEKRTTPTVDSDGKLSETQSNGSAAVKWVAAGVLGLIILGVGVTISNLSKAASTSDAYVASSSSSAPSSTDAPKVNTQGLQRGRIGEVVHVGDLDLRIISVTGFNSTKYNRFNDANTAVTLEATNVRGKVNATYNFSPTFALTLVDGNGVGTTPTFSCAGCPDEIGTVDLTTGGTIRGTVYFKLPSSSTSWTQVRYQALMSSNQAIIS